MKYHNGCWLLKEGYGSFSPQQVYEVTKKDTEVILCAPTSRISHKGDTLGGINLTLRITAPLPEVIRVQVYHHMGVRKKGPEVELNLSGGRKLEVSEELSSGDTKHAYHHGRCDIGSPWAKGTAFDVLEDGGC